MDARAREIFRRIVESYLETGEPVGSRTLSKGGLSLSPASIRNTMQDLTQLGLLGAPHVSAGRLPTHAGLRLFVDGLLEVGDVGEAERRAIETRLLAHGRNYEDALNEASSILSGLAGGAGVVVSPGPRRRGQPRGVRAAVRRPRRWRSWSSTTASVENRLMRQPVGRDALGAAGGLQLPQRPHARAAPCRRPRPTCAPNWTGRGANSTRPPRAWSRTAWPPGAAARPRTAP